MKYEPTKRQAAIVTRSDLVYPELSYRIVGALLDVYRELGNGHREYVYQRAVAAALKDRGVRFVEQVPVAVDFHGQKVGQQYLDFLIEDAVILELKQGDRFQKTNIDQVNRYLRSTGKQLALLANFTSRSVAVRRMLNIPGYHRGAIAKGS